MASERLSRALMSMGEGFDTMANVEMTRERDEADRLHRESMERLRNQFATEAQGRDIGARMAETAADRAAREAEATRDREFSSTEAEKDRKARSSEAAEDRNLTTRRLDDADRRGIETQATGMLADIDDRVIKLRDKMMEMKAANFGELDPDIEKQITDELSQLSEARTRIRHQMISQLSSMGDQRYAGMDEEQRLIEAGYSPRQIEAFRKLAEQESGGGAEQPAQNPNAINPDDIIKRPQKRRRSRAREILSESDDALKPKKQNPEGFVEFQDSSLGKLFDAFKAPGVAEAAQQEKLRRSREIM